MSDHFKEAVGLADIKRMIPHRYPFLLVDRVERMVEGKSAVGIKNVTANEPHFEGHFPDKAVMPGVLQVEALAQTAAVMVVNSLDLIDKGMLVYFMSIDEVKFRRVVEPGDVLELHVETIRGRGKVWKFRGEAKVNGELATECVFAAMIAPGESEA
ncbi:3-hydroxyacyl-ACP dehydratase FabZ [Pontivivens insulae]|uniref:3-hydroxyacyl-[acyl-carrier-protein] dehydratase FabZ n=1 Tax=Pontivivens insulae TaxID=1639689 RepID=A0A2R8AAN2_9RHOB|nr:3-hydroxyacyl-ACP dehydratase FabZ [Pontivivens insulae]RED13215.1 3-hydroxyacyl-[acyl-carrier-protein] dehydratase [Pontivivens insulae]SPF29307.1 3-hydroxyacyl-[acyl-carrier-protein] dehydratase FabZ [Pontivivens insulae]